MRDRNDDLSQRRRNEYQSDDFNRRASETDPGRDNSRGRRDDESSYSNEGAPRYSWDDGRIQFGPTARPENYRDDRDRDRGTRDYMEREAWRGYNRSERNDIDRYGYASRDYRDYDEAYDERRAAERRRNQQHEPRPPRYPNSSDTRYPSAGNYGYYGRDYEESPYRTSYYEGPRDRNWPRNESTRSADLGRYGRVENFERVERLSDASPSHMRYNEGPYRGRGPKNYRRSDERIREDVNEFLAQHALIDATHVNVEVKAGEVTLNGNIRSRAEKRMAEDVAANVSGVVDVNNQLRIMRDEEAGESNSMNVSQSSSTGQNGLNEKNRNSRPVHA